MPLHQSGIFYVTIFLLNFEDQYFNLFPLDFLTNSSYGLPIKYF